MFTSTTSAQLLLDQVNDFGVAVLIILTAVTTVGVAWLIYVVGWGQVKTSTNPGSSRIPLSGDRMHRSAIARGRILNRRDGIDI